MLTPKAKLSAMIFVAALAIAVDPLRLPLGDKGESTVMLGQMLSMRTHESALAEDVAAAADGHRFVFLGEQHATELHQKMQAKVIEALIKRGRKVVIGVEYITRPKQEWLDKWSADSVDESAFLEGVDWKKQWGYDYKFYRPIFEVARQNKLPVLALNVPRDWVRAVGKQGFAGLTAEQASQLPSEMFLGNKNHRQVFSAMMQGHEPSPNIYSAQVLWDEGMADTAAKWLATNGTKNTVIVIVAGSGHVMYGQGINYRLKRNHGGDGPTVVMTDGTEPVTVSNGLADFVYVTRQRTRG